MFDEYQVGCFYLDKEKELFKEVFVQRIWQDGRVWVSLCVKKLRESGEAQSQFFSEIGREELASVITKLIDIPAGITEGSRTN